MSKRVGPEEHFNDDLPLFDAPPHNGTATSMAAAKSVESQTTIMRQKVYDFVASRGASGCTREDIEILLEMSGSTVRPRVLELIRAGRIYVVEGVTRSTESGRQAEVLRAALS